MQEPGFTCSAQKIPGENLARNNLIANINLQIGFALAIDKII
jgi:hypothetical protein